MFNFLNSKLLPKVECKAPVSDHYEPENLISSDANKKARGFIAYPSIKPPVEIEFKFLCPVNIHYILLDTTVGFQKCSGIEILAKTDSLSYDTICRAIYNASKICFCNIRKYSAVNRPPHIDYNHCHLAFFKSNMFKFFLNASAIKIIIFRTEKSVPCLGSVEVWGTPSKTCSSTTIQTINRLMQNASYMVPSTSTSESVNNFEIPEDFKDALTEEIMTIPMTLPCGKSVDQVTLEKHIESEKSFGRKPCDPFTGIKFTDIIKPIMNVALKSRIDMFLIQNAHRPETYNLKRTLGRSSNKRNLTDCSGETSSASKITKQSSNNSNSDRTGDSESEQCPRCKNNVDFLYLLPCTHHLCRNCLLTICKNKSLSCFQCYKQFSKSDIQKINL